MHHITILGKKDSRTQYSNIMLLFVSAGVMLIAFFSAGAVQRANVMAGPSPQIHLTTLTAEEGSYSNQPIAVAGAPECYVQDDGRIEIRYRTDSDYDASALDYLALAYTVR